MNPGGVVWQWAAEHLAVLTAQESEIGNHLRAALDELETTVEGVVFDAENAEKCVREWVEVHLHNSPVSQNTTIWNVIQPNLQKLKDALVSSPAE